MDSPEAGTPRPTKKRRGTGAWSAFLVLSIMCFGWAFGARSLSQAHSSGLPYDHFAATAAVVAAIAAVIGAIFFVLFLAAIYLRVLKRWQRRRWGILVLIVLAAVFAAGYFTYRLWLVLLVPGVAFAVLAAVNPRGLGANVTAIVARLRLPRVRPRTAGVGVAAWIGLYLVVVPGLAAYSGGFTNAVLHNIPYDGQVEGYAALSTPLSGATVRVSTMNTDGTPGTLLATEKTDSDGHYRAYFKRHPIDLLLVVTSGGTYTDGVTGAAVTAGPTDALETVLQPQSTYSSITPLTTMATARAVQLQAEGRPQFSSVQVSFSGVGREFDLTTMTQDFPMVASTSPQESIAPGALEDRQVALIHAGIAVEAHDLGISEMALTHALARDISDGYLDGKEGGKRIHASTAVLLPPDAGGSRLQDAIDRGAKSPQNKQGIPSPKILMQPAGIGLNTGGLYISSAALPAWREGQASQVRIEGNGGSAPYRCRVNGEMPYKFTLDQACLLSGTAPSLGAGEMIISPPFSVTMTDSSGAQVTFELRVTVVPAPPTITVQQNNCPTARVRCTNAIVALGHGGRPNYYYKVDSFLSGSPPLAMILDTHNGTVNGVPFHEGTYDFTVCVVDSVAGMSCIDTSIIVGPAAGPTPDVPGPQPSERPVPPPVQTPNQNRPSCPPSYPYYDPVTNKCYQNPGGAAGNASYWLHFSCGASTQCAQVMGYSYGVRPLEAMTQARCYNLRDTNALGMQPWNGQAGTWCSTSPNSTPRP